MIRLSQFRVRRTEPELPGKRTLLHLVHVNDQHKRLKCAGRKSAPSPNSDTWSRGFHAGTPGPLADARLLGRISSAPTCNLEANGSTSPEFSRRSEALLSLLPRPASSPQHAHGSARCLQPQGDWPRREGADWFRGAQPGEGWEHGMLHSRISRP